ncbi:MAG: chloride channel protein [Acidobacteria bacterium]|nr:chloride channel protein [Acidobacteriota bacterium]
MARTSQRKLLLVFIVAGVVSGIAAVLFHEWIELSRSLLFDRVFALQAVPRTLLIVTIPTVVAALLGWTVQRFAPSALGANLARVKRSYAEDVAHLDPRTLLATFALTPLSLGSGAPLGPEGPTVVVTSGLSAWVARVFGLPKRLWRGMIPVGTAAGIAAIFRTPITGVVFALEELSGTSSRSILGGTLLAAVAAAVVQQSLSSHRARILPASAADWADPRELIGFAIVGLCAGLISGAVLRYGARLRDHFRKRVPSIPFRFAIGGAAVGMLGAIEPSMLGVGYPTTSLFLTGGGSLPFAAGALATKVLGFTIAVAAGLLGGTFAPSLFIGSSLGALVGFAGTSVLPGPINVGAYALVGMGAYFAGTLRAPIAAVLIVLELTNDYGLIVPLMLGVVLANTISHVMAPRTLEEEQLEHEGVKEHHAARDPLGGLRACDVMGGAPVTFGPATTLAEVIERTRNERHHDYPVVDADGRVLGMLSGDEIARSFRAGLFESPIAEMLAPPPMVARMDEALHDVLDRMAQRGAERCLVVDVEERVQGTISPSDLVRARFREQMATGDDTFS